MVLIEKEQFNRTIKLTIHGNTYSFVYRKSERSDVMIRTFKIKDTKKSLIPSWKAKAPVPKLLMPMEYDSDVSTPKESIAGDDIKVKWDQGDSATFDTFRIRYKKYREIRDEEENKMLHEYMETEMVGTTTTGVMMFELEFIYDPEACALYVKTLVEETPSEEDSD